MSNLQTRQKYCLEAVNQRPNHPLKEREAHLNTVLRNLKKTTMYIITMNNLIQL